MTENKIFDRITFFLSKPWGFFSIAFIFGFALAVSRVFSEYTSPFDEHTHLSYVQYAYNWIVPAEGYEMLSWAKSAFSCHPHAMYGAMTNVQCGSISNGADYPTGGTNTSQTWPPTYFFIVAILMRLPSLVIADPLFSARFVTAVLWCVGTAWIGTQVFQLTKQKLLGLLVSVTLVALPTFYFYTSNVSPHSLNPMLFALAFYVSNKFIQSSLTASQESNSTVNLGYWLGLLKNKWLLLFVVLGPLFALTIPQSLTIIGVCFIYMFLGLVFSPTKFCFQLLIPRLLVLSTAGIISALLFTKLVSWWSWLVYYRKIPFPPGVNLSGANSDPADPAYSSLAARIIKQWWTYWPNGIFPGWPAGQDVSAVLTPWLFLLTGLSLAALLYWNRENWLSRLMLSVFIAAPIFAVAYDLYFSTAVPIRYGMGVTMAGVLSMGNERMARPAKIALTAIVGITYISAFFLNMYFVDARTCHLDTVSQLIQCG